MPYAERKCADSIQMGSPLVWEPMELIRSAYHIPRAYGIRAAEYASVRSGLLVLDALFTYTGELGEGRPKYCAL